MWLYDCYPPTSIKIKFSDGSIFVLIRWAHSRASPCFLWLWGSGFCPLYIMSPTFEEPMLLSVPWKWAQPFWTGLPLTHGTHNVSHELLSNPKRLYCIGSLLFCRDLTKKLFMSVFENEDIGSSHFCWNLFKSYILTCVCVKNEYRINEDVEMNVL